MKSIRNIITIFVLALSIGLLVSSCEIMSSPKNANKKQSTEKVSSSTKERHSDSAETKDEAKDTTSAEEKIKDAITEITKLKAEVDKLQSAESWIWVSVGLGILALVLCVICLVQYSNLQERANRHRCDINQTNNAVKDAFHKVQANLTSLSSDCAAARRKIEGIECKVNKLVSDANAKGRSLVQNETGREDRKGYFGYPIQTAEPYFKKILYSRDYDALFEVEIMGDNACFKPLESTHSSYLGTFLSSDSVRAAVDFAGCATSDATGMKVEESGTATKKGDKWYITNKSKVRLIR